MRKTTVLRLRRALLAQDRLENQYDPRNARGRASTFHNRFRRMKRAYTRATAS